MKGIVGQRLEAIGVLASAIKRTCFREYNRGYLAPDEGYLALLRVVKRFGADEGVNKDD